MSGKTFRMAMFLWLICLYVTAGWADFRSLVILHTNDLHDHVRPDYDGRGGLPYMAGYIARERAGRTDVLLLDAGDVMEKGDLVAHLTQSKFTYELLGRLNYDAVTVGNHDFAYGWPHLRACLDLLQGAHVVCANLLDDQGQPLTAPSAVLEKNRIRVAIIGLITDTDDAKVLPWTKTVTALQQEVERLKSRSDVLVVLAHLGKRECLILAEACPDVHLFVGGHAHEVLLEPVKADSGAWIVQAGSYGEYVGRVELEVDPESRKVLLKSAELVPMDHDKIQPDEAMLAAIRERENQVCPEASEVLGRSETGMGVGQLARLAARAFARKGKADIGCCHTGLIFRDSLPAGVVDRNAVFRTGGQRGEKLVSAQLRGQVLRNYQAYLLKTKKGLTAMATAEGDIAADRLDANRGYRVVMPEREWNSRFLRVLDQAVQPEPVEITFTDALAEELVTELDSR